MTGADLLARVNDLRSRRMPFVLATVVRVERPASAQAGDRALVLPDGTIEGFVGGDCAQSTVRLQALRQLEAGEPALLRIAPADHEAGPSGDGLVTACNPCLSGGTLEIFLEVVRPPMLVSVFGDSPIARALQTLGGAMNWDVRITTCPQSAFAPDTAAVLVASHGGEEQRVIGAALRAGIGYVGLVASRRRGRGVLAGLDVTDEERARVHTPAGLDIAAHGPAEIAVSILAEIIACRPLGRAAPAAGVPAGQTAAMEPEVARMPGPARTPGPQRSADAAPAADAARVLDGVRDPAGVRAPDHVRSPGDAGIAGAAAAPPAAGTALRELAGPAAAEMVDPVCGMTVAVASASPHADHAGMTWYFCGSGCREAFTADPGRYTA